MANYQVRGFRNVFLTIGFMLLLAGAIIFTGALLAGSGLSGGLLAILGELLLIGAALNIFYSLKLKY